MTGLVRGHKSNSKFNFAPGSIARLATWLIGGIVLIDISDSALLPHRVPTGEIAYGAILGTVYALLAIGLILVYQSNRIINFAVAEFGVFGAIVYQNLQGQAKIPWIFAVAAGIFSAMAAGFAMERFLARRFAESSRLILSVATIGMAQLVAFGEIEVSKHFGTVPASAGLHTPLSNMHFTFGGVIFDGNSIALLGAAISIIVGLELFLHRSDFGIAIRASAENAPRASLLGVPVKTASTVSWTIAALIAGIASVLQAPMTGVVAGGTVVGPTLLYKALAVAVIADFSDLRAAIVAGLLLGIMEQSVTYSYSGSTVTDALFVAITIGALLFRRKRVSRIIESSTSSWRAIREFRKIPKTLARNPRVIVIRSTIVLLSGGALLLGPLAFSTSQQFDLGGIVAFALIAISCVVVTGWSGQISLGQFAIAAVGAIVAAKLFEQAHWDFFISLLLGGIAGSGISILLGAVATRVQGFLFAVTSLGFAIALESYFLNPKYFSFLVPSDGFLELNRPNLFGRYDLSNDLSYYYFALLILVLLGFSLATLRKSRTGRVIISAKDNDRASLSYGISRTRSLLTSFAISGFTAGIAGGLYAFHAGSFTPGDYTASQSITVFGMAVIGGLGSVATAAIGAGLIEGWNFLFAQNQALEALGTAGGLTLVLLLVPEGIGSLLYKLRDMALGPFSPDAQERKGGSAPAEPNAPFTMVASGLPPGDPRLAFAPPPPPPNNESRYRANLPHHSQEQS